MEPSKNSSLTTYQRENNSLLQNFLNRTFFATWLGREKFENFRRMEFTLSGKCNLACKYCYYTRFRDELYPNEIDRPEQIIANTEKMCQFLAKHDMAPEIEIFSGEPLAQKVGYEAIKSIIRNFAHKERKPRMSIPTNCTFLLDDKKVEDVLELAQESREANIGFHLSASVDGKYCEPNRPFANGQEPRDDAYYDKLFAFGQKSGINFGFHPMVYSEHIEDWPDNFDWFQEMFEKHGLIWDRIYLLEVRNAEWTTKQMEGLARFVKHVMRFAHKKSGGTPASFYNFLIKAGFNMLRSPLTTHGRGIGCGLQAALHVRMGDLTFGPCHRLTYPQFNLGRFVTNANGEITGEVECFRPELAITSFAFDGKTQPYCETCILRDLCSLGCLGSQYETTGDMFTPVPSVCQMEFYKIAAMVEGYKELGVWETIISKTNPNKKLALEFIAEEIK